MLRRLAILTLCSAGVALASAGQMRTWGGRDFILGILEPDGWIAEVSDVTQIAHFVLHPAEQTWRDADSVIYVRLVPRSDEESVDGFVEQNMENLRESCPLIDFQDYQFDVHGSRDFTTKGYDCPGHRYEVASVTAVPGYFALLALSSRTDAELKQNLPVFKEVLKSFYWQQRERIPKMQKPESRSRPPR